MARPIDVTSLQPRERRLRGAPGEPEHLGSAAIVFRGVAEVEHAAGRSRGVNTETSGAFKVLGSRRSGALAPAQSKVGAGCGLERAQHERNIACRIVPIGLALRPSAIRPVGGERSRQTVHGKSHDGFALLQIVFGHRQRAQRKSAVADRIPIVAIDGPAHLAFVNRDGGIQALLKNGVPHRLPIVGAERAVKPVVTDRHGMGDFRGVQEMSRIPVVKSRQGPHLFDGPIQILPLAVQPVHQGKSIDAADGEPWQSRLARTQQPVVERRDSNQVVGVLAQLGVETVSLRYVMNDGAQLLEIVVIQ